MTIVDQIRRQRAELSPAEKRVADVVLEDPDRAMHTPMARLARRAEVSEPTVVRFCRSLGLDGYQAFKLALAKGLAQGTPFVSPHVDEADDAHDLIRKVFRGSAAALIEAAEGIDAAEVSRGIEVLAAGKRLVFFGVGGSGVVALDAAHKFLRLDVPSTALIDNVLQRMAAAGMGPDDAVLAVSNTGQTRSLVETAALARDRGAKIVSITAPGSRLAAVSDAVIAIEPCEDLETFTPMASRLNHLAAVDLLVTGVLLARGSGIRDRLAAIKATVASTRYPDDEPHEH